MIEGLVLVIVGVTTVMVSLGAKTRALNWLPLSFYERFFPKACEQARRELERERVQEEARLWAAWLDKELPPVPVESDPQVVECHVCGGRGGVDWHGDPCDCVECGEVSESKLDRAQKMARVREDRYKTFGY